MKFRFTYYSPILILFVCLIGCASTTTINSVPSSGDLYLDGIKMGQTPYTHTDTDILFSQKVVQIKKEGYDDFTGFIKRDKINAQNAVLSALCFWPTLLWSWDYPPSYTFSLQKKVALINNMDFQFYPGMEMTASN